MKQNVDLAKAEELQQVCAKVTEMFKKAEAVKAAAASQPVGAKR